MQKVGGKVEEFVLTNSILMQHSWKHFLIWYSTRKYMANIHVWLTVGSIDPGWESNPGHLFGYHTTRPPRFLQILSIQFQWTKIRLLISYTRRCTTRNCSGQGRFLKIRALWLGQFNLGMEKIRAFFPKLEHFFMIFKKGQGASPSPCSRAPDMKDFYMA